jgi:hypothetical protein
MLRTLAGAAAAALLPAAARAAPCGKAGQPCGCCRGGLTCTNGTCCDDALVCNGACCPAGYRCQGGACVRSGGGGGNPGGCPPGQALCGQGCVDIAADAANCGACGTACPAPAHGTATCGNGTCGVACDAGYAPCEGACVDPARVCQNAAGPFCCPPGQICVDGECFPCESGTATWCVEASACVGDHATDVGLCQGPDPLTYCQASGCAYWEIAYVCHAEPGFPGRVACCTPGVDCPGRCMDGGADDPGFVPCPPDPSGVTSVICAGTPVCLPPDAQ